MCLAEHCSLLSQKKKKRENWESLKDFKAKGMRRIVEKFISPHEDNCYIGGKVSTVFLWFKFVMTDINWFTIWT